jgi:heme-degrading monooxygenase HmoA
MILEIAILTINRGLSIEFENNFEKAKEFISSVEGYISHELKKTDNFQQWKRLVHHFYEPFPKKEYYG